MAKETHQQFLDQEKGQKQFEADNLKKNELETRKKLEKLKIDCMLIQKAVEFEVESENLSSSKLQNSQRLLEAKKRENGLLRLQWQFLISKDSSKMQRIRDQNQLKSVQLSIKELET